MSALLSDRSTTNGVQTATNQARTDAVPPPERGEVIAISISPGGIPKAPQSDAWLTVDGFIGDGRNHTKHIRRERAVSLLDDEILEQLQEEGFCVAPGVIGENLTLRGVHVQAMSAGALLRVGQTILRLEEPRKPCYVLDVIDPRLKEVIVGRCGYLASVVRGGMLLPGAAVEVLESGIG